MALYIGNKAYGAGDEEDQTAADDQTSGVTQDDTEGDAAQAGDQGEEAQAAGEQKYSQQEAQYGRGLGRSQCGKCTHFEHDPGEEMGGCDIVDGDITPYGTCRYYEQMPNPYGAPSPQEKIQYMHRIMRELSTHPQLNRGGQGGGAQQ